MRRWFVTEDKKSKRQLKTFLARVKLECKRTNFACHAHAQLGAIMVLSALCNKATGPSNVLCRSFGRGSAEAVQEVAQYI